MTTKYKYPNDLVIYRQRMQLSQTQVGAILRTKGTKWLSNLELGRRLPSLLTAMKLAIVYRIPVDFLYRDTYRNLHTQLRKREEEIHLGRQGVLFGSADD